MDCHENPVSKFTNQIHGESSRVGLEDRMGPVRRPYQMTQLKESLPWAGQFNAVASAMGQLKPEIQAQFEGVYREHPLVQKREMGQGMGHRWAEEFTPQQVVQVVLPQHLQTQFDQAFESAQQSVQWQQEFQNGTEWSQEFNVSQADEWTQEFNQFKETDTSNIAATAGALLDAVKDSDNPKFKDSQFFGFMEQLRDKKIAIEGDKVVEQISSFDWASEFHQGLKPSNWEEEFVTGSNQESWGAEFGKKDWASEFQNKEWSEFTDLNPDELPQDWKDMESRWNEIRDQENLNSLSNPRFSEYPFTVENPYLDGYDTPSLESLSGSSNAIEAILALEALVQLNPQHTSAWLQLGFKQQENENDVNAIVALRKALEMDPANLDALMSLSVAFTNENLMSEAYQALESWLANHPLYHTIPSANPQSMSSMDRHAEVVGKFLLAARSQPRDLDENVQTALGILFNISSEYDKAVDCFKSALSKRPNDYLLWNKLGASYANSSRPEQAIECYFKALALNPSFTRTRYNIAISSISMGQYRESAEHLLLSLGLQRDQLEQVLEKNRKSSLHTPEWKVNATQSDALWKSLRTLMDTYSK